MKKAEEADWLSRIRTNRDLNSSLQAFKLKTSSAIKLSPGINFFVGANGAGKSRILTHFYKSLTGASFDCIFSLKSIPTEEKVVFFSTGEVSEKYRLFFKEFNNIKEDLLNGNGEKILSDEELKEVSWLTLKKYSKFKVTEIEDYKFQGFLNLYDNSKENDKNITIPFFEVELAGNCYDSRTMGSGEYSALLIWWTLNRSSEKSVIILEEPETYLSSVVQHNISILIAKYSVKNKIFFLISTHSYAIVRNYPSHNIINLLLSPNGIKISNTPSTNILEHIGAFYNDQKYLFITEDELSCLFINFIIDRNLIELSNQAKVIYLKGGSPLGTGASGIVNLLLTIKKIQNFNKKIIGIFDYDQKEEPTFKNEELNNNEKILLLEGKTLEEEFIQIINDNIQIFEEDFPGITESIENFQHLDHHDFLIELSKSRFSFNLSILKMKCLNIYTKIMKN